MKYFTLLLPLLFTLTARAGAWVEPGLGFNYASYKLTDLSDGTNTGKGSGLSASVKAGYIFTTNMALGLEYDYANGKSTDDTNSTEYTNTSNMLGVHFGYYQIGGIRVSLTYGISNSTKVKPETGFDSSYKQGAAYKIGLGYQVAPHVALNFEYLRYEPKKLSVGGGPEANVSDTYSKAEFSSMRFLVSFPFE